MSHKLFIPITDEVLYDYPELITSPLLPYHVDNPCFHWMATIESTDDTNGKEIQSKRYGNAMAADQPTAQIGSRLA